MQIDQRRDLITSIVFLIFGIAVIIASGNIPIKNVNGDVGSAFLPEMVAGIMIFLSIILFAKTCMHIKKSKPLEEKNNAKIRATVETNNKQKGFAGNKAVFASFINLCVYVVLFKPVGFILSSIIFLVLQMGIMTEDSKITARKLAIWCVISVVTAVLVYLIFYEIFSMRLPMGLLDSDE
ncbi:hypothetical protein SDC9_53151 [bioreactor metagenome]|uniref:DUF1468 domain-containing protein n=1 Tax=bioreactor metagenome TaxID=1076179 RepID=A0A644WTR3_9ZZZZ|nr:tripartite tricarboxylate transporter TctB family protein [Acidaminococcaceae bacterium]